MIMDGMGRVDCMMRGRDAVLGKVPPSSADGAIRGRAGVLQKVGRCREAAGQWRDVGGWWVARHNLWGVCKLQLGREVLGGWKRRMVVALVWMQRPLLLLLQISLPSTWHHQQQHCCWKAVTNNTMQQISER
jgi:hypothetical protein